MKMSLPDEDPPILDMNYFAEYDKDFGFKVAIDGVHNVKQEGFYVVIMSLNPPAALYSDAKVPTSDVNLFASFDWESSI